MLSNIKKIQAIRFVIVGGGNTVLTYIIYIVLLSFLNYQLAYTVTFIIGIAIAYSLNTVLVFRKKWRWKKLLQFPIVYLFQYVFGFTMMNVLVDYFSLDENIAPILVVVMVLPVTFFLSRLVIDRW